MGSAATIQPGIDDDKLNSLVHQMLGDLGGAASVTMVRMGDALGLYRALRENGPMTSAELARAARVDERYLREWLSHQAASNYLAYDPESGRFALTPEQAMIFAEDDSPVNMLGAFDLMAAMQQSHPKVEAAFRSGEGVAWGDLSGCLWCATARFFRPGYHNNLVQSWLPALEEVKAKLENGAEVADVGCGAGWSTVIMAKAFPNSRFTGYDYHPPSIESAREHAREHGVEANTRFEVAQATGTPADGRFDLVTFFDCLHDMGDPVSAAAHVRRMLKPDGSWMVVEPMAGDRLEDNLNPVGRLYYAGSTMICIPTSKSQEVGMALGAQAGETRLREVMGKAGFGRVRRAAETPFNMVLEARP
ncbi:SAM-dependent methyltransferase [Falsiroseomonas bella]|uniref:SAM-dependent methyltransferase n=1 Tax=Falsiroseomonas bella TaxID=2184016 RepID=A0A317FAT4_9PROT|nr:class I SAM-dependent methyltransferase [Falsiroseomonas bella]PWS35127.1 SAM-dependent methyltransferase [Falsiroseomonas bella]